MIEKILLPLLLGGLCQAQDSLTRLNDVFRTRYAQAKADALAASGPVLVLAGDRMVLYRNGAPAPGQDVLFRPLAYHRLKAVAHAALGLHLLLAAPEAPGQAELERVRSLTAAARADLAATFAPPLLERQERILDGCLRLLDQRLGGALPPGRLAGFASGMGPLVLANAEDAAGLELEALDRQVAGIRAGLAPGEWKSLRVLILGSHMAREGEASLQFFCRLLGEPGEGGRIIYAESLWQVPDALSLLATHAVDRGASAAFFGDPGRLHRDILADGAGAWLGKHPLSR